MPDFTTVFQDDFNGSSLDTGVWRAQYSGQYGNGMFRWDPGQLEVGDGKLTIATEREGGSWVSGGLSTIPDGQTYGRYEFRARFEEGQGTVGVALLWPSDNVWDDEVDIIETNRPDRDGFTFSNHGNPQINNEVWVDVDNWHTYTLDWTPGSLTLSVDGRQVSQITTDVPDQQMSLGFQGQVMAPNEWWFGGGPDGSTPNRVEIEIDWVRVSAWTPGSGSDPQPAPQAAPAPQTEAASGSSGGTDDYWMAAAQRYVENDGTWEGSWRNQVASGQITLEDVASRLQAGQGDWDTWN
jgi:beta-glucanase (GH16 family)